MSLLDELRLPDGPVDLRKYDTNSAPGVGADKHTVGLVDPVGVKITSFNAPEPGYLGVFDRSHPGDVDERQLWGQLPGGVRDCAGAHQHRVRSVAPRAERQEVVSQPGHRRAAPGDPGPARPRLARARFDVAEEKKRLEEDTIS